MCLKCTFFELLDNVYNVAQKSLNRQTGCTFSQKKNKSSENIGRHIMHNSDLSFCLYSWESLKSKLFTILKNFNFQETEGDHLAQDWGSAEWELYSGEGSGAGAHLPVQSGGRGWWVGNTDFFKHPVLGIQSATGIVNDPVLGKFKHSPQAAREFKSFA